jgi:hypothetical protein
MNEIDEKIVAEKSLLGCLNFKEISIVHCDMMKHIFCYHILVKLLVHLTIHESFAVGLIFKFATSTLAYRAHRPQKVII